MSRRNVRHWAAVVVGLSIAAVSSAWGQPDAPAPGLDPFVEESPLLREPKTPEEAFSATLLMVDLARLDLAQRYLKQLVEANPDDETLIALRNKHGTAEFVKLSRIQELEGLARRLLERLSEASRKQADDPAYANELIERLGGDFVQRELALRELRNLGEGAIPHLLRKLAATDSAEQIDRVIGALARMGRMAVEPALAGLDAPQSKVRLAVLNALGLIQGKEAIPFLWHPAFAASESPEIQMAARRALARIATGSEKIPERLTVDLAANELRRLARGFYFRQFHAPLDDDGAAIVWSWDEKAGTVVRSSMPAERAQLLLAARFARQSLDISPEDAEAQRMYLGSMLGWTVTTAGRDRPLPLDPGTPGYIALTAGEETVAQVLSDALAAARPAAAQGALQILGQIGSREQILGEQGRKTPVLAALNYPDLRVQFAAANTILRMEPDRNFRGADRVISILNRSINMAEEAKALVVDADTSRAEITAGYLADLGFKPVMVRTGKEGFVVASTQSGVELAVIHVNCIQWDLSQTVANFRADARTAYLPLAIYGPEDVRNVETRSGRRDALVYPEASSSLWGGALPPGGQRGPMESTTRSRLSRMIARNAPAIFVAESGSASDFVAQVRPFMNAVKGSQLTGEERGQYRAVAARWLAHLAQTDQGRIFNLALAEQALSDLIDVDELAHTALVALSGIPSKSVQGRLTTVAINPQDQPAVRVAAANQLAFHIQRHGVMLTEEQLREIHLAWKGETDPAVSSALATVVGSLHPEAKLVGERLGKLPPPR